MFNSINPYGSIQKYSIQLVHKIPQSVQKGSIIIIGYLLYRIVKWIIDTCSNTKKINKIMQENIIDEKLMSNKKITIGYGEYVVFHQYTETQSEPISAELFKTVYSILQEHSPTTIMMRNKTNPEKGNEECINRYELMKQKINQIDPTIKITFIPRTLYELTLVQECIEEDLREGNLCEMLGGFPLPQNPIQYMQERKCWHIPGITNGEDNNYQDIIPIAYRLNKVIFEQLLPCDNGFTYKELAAFTEKKIQYLKAHYEIGKSEGPDAKFADCNIAGPTSNFRYDFNRYRSRSMCIRNDNDASIIRNAVALECKTYNSFLIYRGSNFSKDSIIFKGNSFFDSEKPFSLSYGTSLLAGCVHDAGATALTYMLQESNDAYVIQVPFTQMHSSPFYIPKGNTIHQIYGKKDFFHVRTVAWINFNGIMMNGIRNRHSYTNGLLDSNLDKTKMINSFQEYKKNSIFLKPLRNTS